MNKFQARIRERNIPEGKILADLRRVAYELSKNTVTKSEYDDKGNFGATTILRKFKQWNLALQKVGLDAPNRQHIPDAELFENIANVWTRIGRQPFGREMDKAGGMSTFSLGAYESRFGSWNKALLAFEAFINSGEAGQCALPAQNNARLNRRTGRKINWRLRAQVLIRDNCICRMCGASPVKDPHVNLHVDHIEPWSKGGETVFENLRTLCHKCNIGKSDF